MRQLAGGALVGLAVGAVASAAFVRLPAALQAFAPVASVATAAIAFGLADIIGASGFLSVYIAGLWLGNTRFVAQRAVLEFHQGLAFLAQVVLFVVLGLLVFPSRLDSVMLSALALAAVLIFVARPLAVWVSTLFQGFRARERALLGWAGLRGAVPIVLATFPLSAGVAESDTIFHAVFFVVVASTLLQGPTLEPLARRLQLATSASPVHGPPIEVGARHDLELLEYLVDGASPVANRPVRDLDLPRDALVAVIVRGDDAVPPRGATVLRAGDRLYVVARAGTRASVDVVFGEGGG